MSPCSSDYIFTDKKVGVWRVVSEDSDYLGPRPTMIHALGDLDDFNQTRTGQMRFPLDQLQAFNELQEVTLLGSSQRILLKNGMIV